MADSVSEAVGDAIEAALTALAILKPGVAPDTPVPISRRKTPSLPEGKSPPELVVSVGAFGRVEPIDARRDMVGYPLAVTIVTAGGTAAAYEPLIDNWRQRVRRAVQARATWAAVGGWNSVETEGKEPFDSAALPKDFNFSVQVFTVFVLEPRS